MTPQLINLFPYNPILTFNFLNFIPQHHFLILLIVPFTTYHLNLLIAFTIQVFHLTNSLLSFMNYLV